MAETKKSSSKVKGFFKSGSGGGPSEVTRDHSKGEAQPAARETNNILHLNCSCCHNKIALRQSFRKRKCHGCDKKVCKKCYVVKKLCHVCVVKQRPEVKSAEELRRMEMERLTAILDELHCDPVKFKGDRNAMVHALLTTCQLPETLQAYKGPPPKRERLKQQRIPTKQPENLPPNAVYIDLHRISMPPQGDDDATPTALQQMLDKLEQAQRMSHGRNGHSSTNGTIEEQTNYETDSHDSLTIQSPEMVSGLAFAFLPDHVIHEEDEEDEAEKEVGSGDFATPPLTPTFNRKSQIEVFYSTDDVSQLVRENHLLQQPDVELNEIPKDSEVELDEEIVNRAEAERIRSILREESEIHRVNFQTEVEKHIEMSQTETEVHGGASYSSQLEQEENCHFERKMNFREETDVEDHVPLDQIFWNSNVEQREFQSQLERIDSNGTEETNLENLPEVERNERSGSSSEVEAMRAKIRAEIQNSELNFFEEEEEADTEDSDDNIFSQEVEVKLNIQPEIKPRTRILAQTEVEEETENLSVDEEHIYENVTRKYPSETNSRMPEQEGEYSPINVKAEVNKFEQKLDRLNREYKAQYKLKFEDLTTVKDEREIRRLSLFQLKTIQQRRGQAIVGFSYEDIVQGVIRLWKEDKLNQEQETKEEVKQEMIIQKQNRTEEEIAWMRYEMQTQQLEQEIELNIQELTDEDECKLNSEMEQEVKRDKKMHKKMEQEIKKYQQKMTLVEEPEITTIQRELQLEIKELNLVAEVKRWEEASRQSKVHAIVPPETNEQQQEAEMEEVQLRIEMEIIENKLRIERLRNAIHDKCQEYSSEEEPDVANNWNKRQELPLTPSPSPTSSIKEQVPIQVYEEIVCVDGKSKCTGYDDYDEDEDYL